MVSRVPLQFYIMDHKMDEVFQLTSHLHFGAIVHISCFHDKTNFYLYSNGISFKSIITLAANDGPTSPAKHYSKSLPSSSSKVKNFNDYSNSDTKATKESKYPNTKSKYSSISSSSNSARTTTSSSNTHATRSNITTISCYIISIAPNTSPAPRMRKPMNTCCNY